MVTPGGSTGAQPARPVWLGYEWQVGLDATSTKKRKEKNNDHKEN